MGKIVLFDTEANHANLLPLSFTRPVSEFRVGICTIAQKWARQFSEALTVLTPDYLQEKYPLLLSEADAADSLWIASNLLPDTSLTSAIKGLKAGEKLVDATGCLLAFRGSKQQFEALIEGSDQGLLAVEYSQEYKAINWLYDVFQLNGEAIVDDYKVLTEGRVGQPACPSNTIIGPTHAPDGTPLLFIEEGASVQGSILNLTSGPIYVGKNAQIMEGSAIRGPFALCEGSSVNMITKIYPGTTIGPSSKVGGEINNVVIFGYSNKSHDGYLGNAVIGEWCNLGAGTSASNLKNDYSKIRLWNYPRHTFMRTDLQFCGLMMGDHSKAGINCMFNTATVVGVGCNIHGAGFPRPFVPSFSEGSPTTGFSAQPLKKFFDTAQRAMSRRNIELTEVDRRLYTYISTLTNA